MNEIHRSNQRYWQAQSERWAAMRDRDGLWRRCPGEPELAFDGGALELLRDRVGDLAGRARSA